MPDTAKIQPALTAEEWAAQGKEVEFDGKYGPVAPALVNYDVIGVRLYNPGGSAIVINPALYSAVIALCNAALPDDDPRKITRADVEAVRECGKFAGGDEGLLCEQVAAKLHAMLPPEHQ